jgi:hypothetical protein
MNLSSLIVVLLLNVPSRADAPTALVMAVLFLAFGVFAFVSPDKVRAAMDSFADSWKEGSWHPYKMPLPLLRVVVGCVFVAGAALFFYIAYVGFSR